MRVAIPVLAAAALIAGSLPRGQRGAAAPGRTQLCAVGGAAYITAVAFLRWRS
ncbi:MAG: hypothetical protein M3N56_05895 [Actinomycetota bacterium]|nr:hypothetical protein [Actinomycetota bacterium]